MLLGIENKEQLLRDIEFIFCYQILLVVSSSVHKLVNDEKTVCIRSSDKGKKCRTVGSYRYLFHLPFINVKYLQESSPYWYCFLCFHAERPLDHQYSIYVTPNVDNCHLYTLGKWVAQCTHQKSGLPNVHISLLQAKFCLFYTLRSDILPNVNIRQI